ncbi:uncharacterized protein LOC104903187 [Beta vulgaris subsp. vulgaris]|uniref:uncharacterized protein LOC104903187 n=1 Tax=Beta vulgaris subsp. vulgaris TaxID=3555 RepID=UPI00254671CC|nr:uncharacterized protein LOC104903187 [Beta vulgaris subsp. vulgaris]
MKSSGDSISVTIPTTVYGHEQTTIIDYEDMLDWCFQRAIGVTHLSIFMKYLSEKCQEDSVSGMYGFCDPNYLSPLTQISEEERTDYLARIFGQNEGKNVNQLFFAPYHDNRHWMLAVISPWNGVVFWLDPAGAKNDIREFAQRTINEYVVKYPK